MAIEQAARFAENEGSKGYYDEMGQYHSPSGYNPYVVPKVVGDKLTFTDGECHVDKCEHHPTDLEAGIKSDPVNHPAHYTNGPKCQCGRSIECIDITRFFTLLRGTAIKYLWRADYKGNRRQDLEKARWYIQKELDTMDEEE